MAALHVYTMHLQSKSLKFDIINTVHTIFFINCPTLYYFLCSWNYELSLYALTNGKIQEQHKHVNAILYLLQSSRGHRKIKH